MWIAGNIGWLFYDLCANEVSRALLDVVQTGFSIYGYKNWGEYDIHTETESADGEVAEE